MKNENGFSLIELLIVVAIIAIIAAIAVPSLMTSRMASNEASAMQGCRTAGSAEIAYAATNNQTYTDMATLVAGNYLDNRYTNGTGFNGYTYSQGCNVAVTGAPPATFNLPGGFGIIGTPTAGYARYSYGIGVDQTVRYQGNISGSDPAGLSAGDAIGKSAAAGS